MVSKVLFHMLPLLLPFLAYAVFVLVTRRAQARGGVWTEAPWYWLVSSGLAMVIAGFFAVALLGGAPPGSTYVPATYEDGKIKPGRFE